MTTPLVSVVVPAYNEGSRLGPTLERIASYFRSQSLAFEVIVVSDGSTDETASVARAGGDAVKLVELPGKSRQRGRGSNRSSRESRPVDSLHRRRSVVVSRAHGKNVQLNPAPRPTARARRHAVRLQTLRSNRREATLRSGPHQRLRVRRGNPLPAKRFGYRVGEQPVPWFDSVPRRVDAVWHSAQMLKDLARIRLFDLTGTYESAKAEQSIATTKITGEVKRLRR